MERGNLENNWGKTITHDNSQILLLAFQNLIEDKFNKLKPVETRQVLHRICELSDEQNASEKWARDHVFDNYSLLAELMAKLK